MLYQIPPALMTQNPASWRTHSKSVVNHTAVFKLFEMEQDYLHVFVYGSGYSVRHDSALC
jgi:hypothetical protein